MKNLFIISAPSATGKNSVFNAIKEILPEAQRIITCTTRKPREGEVNGKDYYFLTQIQFEFKKLHDYFIEYNTYTNIRYGTLRSEIEKHQDGLEPVFLIIDTHGKMNVVEQYPKATSIFIKPPSFEELEKRIRGRGQNSEKEIALRLEQAERELSKANTYDYIVFNREIKQCAQDIVKIVEKVMSEGVRDDGNC